MPVDFHMEPPPLLVVFLRRFKQSLPRGGQIRFELTNALPTLVIFGLENGLRCPQFSHLFLCAERRLRWSVGL